LTGTLATKCKINGLLAGILVMTGLYSVNLHIMGRSNISVLGSSTLSTYAERAVIALARDGNLNVMGWEITALEASLLVASFLFIVLAGCVMYVFFQTNLGTAMRATGENREMIRALGVNDENMIILGLGVSNGLIALAGAFIAQYQGFADVQMGIGMVVWGLASVIIGEALVGTRQLGLSITGAVMGSVLFRLLVAIALRLGLNPNDLKLVTALFVFLALVAPALLKRLNLLKPRSSHA
jgi:putative ABC transport system permease protein